jgi:hypothetical protein
MCVKKNLFMNKLTAAIMGLTAATLAHATTIVELGRIEFSGIFTSNHY